MCEPITLALTTTQLIMGGIAAAGAAAGAVAAASQAQAQADALGEQREAQAKQIGDAAGLTLGERAKQARAERARLRVAAGESGVSGQSFEAQLLQSSFDQSEDSATIQADTRNRQTASQARTNAELTKTQQPGAIATGLQIVGAGASGAGIGG